MKLTGILILSILIFSLHSCKTDEVILHGEIQGFVTDAISGEPVDSASVTINQSNYSAITGNDGNYLLKNLVPGQYEINVTKSGYSERKTLVNVSSAQICQIDFPLYFAAIPNISVSYLDFGIDSTQLSFTISNSGRNNLIYYCNPGQSWISVNHPGGNLTKNQTDTITVTVNKNELTDTDIYMETIQVSLIASHDEIPERIIDVYVNGVMDIDTNYYKVVTIGNQTWMAENLKVGTQIGSSVNQRDNGTTEHYGYNNVPNFAGGLYQWNEMMQYKPSDSKEFGTTRGICPVGWHIPTSQEWKTLYFYLGGVVAGGKLKEKGFATWSYPNEGATNETLFSALPGGAFSWDHIFEGESFYGLWWSSTENGNEHAWSLVLGFDTYFAAINSNPKEFGYSVRCIKDTAGR